MNIPQPKEMISESLYDQLNDVEEVKSKFLLCIIDFLVQDKVEKVTGILSSIQSTKETEPQIDIKVPIYDALGILESWKNLRIKRFALEFEQFVLPYEGIFFIGSAKISSVDIENAICILHMTLEKE
jgi:hypothetical protein